MGMGLLVAAASWSLVIMYAAVFFRVALHWADDIPKSVDDKAYLWHKISWMSVYMGVVLTSLVNVIIGKANPHVVAAMIVIGQAFLILGGVLAQTGFQINRQGSARAFWFAAAVPVMVLVYFITGSQ